MAHLEVCSLDRIHTTTGCAWATAKGKLPEEHRRAKTALAEFAKGVYGFGRLGDRVPKGPSTHVIRL